MPGSPVDEAYRILIEGALSEDEHFGSKVSLHHDGLLVGAPRANTPTLDSDGAADVFRRRSLPFGSVWERDLTSGAANGRYQHTGQIDAQALRYFGSAIDIHDDLALVSMRGYDVQTDSAPWHYDDGAAVLLQRLSNGWHLQQEFLLTDRNGALTSSLLEYQLNQAGIDFNTSGWQFGHDVAIHGDLMAISAPYAAVPTSAGQPPQPEAGLVLVFARNGSHWQFERLITKNHVSGGSAEAHGFFGFALAISDGVLAISSPHATVSSTDKARGEVYLFRRPTPGYWHHVETLAPSNPNSQFDGARFGWSLDMDGGIVAVGQPARDDSFGTTYFEGVGRAWIYEPDESDPNSWPYETDLLGGFPPPDFKAPQFGDQFGWSIALSRCHVAVGAPAGDSNLTNPGTTYLFTHSGTGVWPFEAYYRSPDGTPGDQWGTSVDLSRRELAIGGRYADYTLPNSGAIELWSINCDCNHNDQSDIIDILLDPSLDCDENGFIDDCEIVWDPSLDQGGQHGGVEPCEPDGILDTCQINPPGSLFWDEAIGGTGHRYEVVAGDISADNAALAAGSLDANRYMGTLIDWEEALFVAIHLGWDPSTGDLWLGGEQRDPASQPDADWTWRTAEPWTWAAWDDLSRPQPDDANGNERMLRAVDPGIPGIWDWDDALGTDTAAAWLAEYDRDCDVNGILDECDIDAYPWLDCDEDGRIDDCMIDDGVVPDCNNNGNPDSCDITSGEPDCNENGRPDTCDLGDGTGFDCNSNGILDECDIDDQVSDDANLNGIPDECERFTINEVLVVPDEDLNGDGDIDYDDQFIEIVNFTDDDVDMSGWRLRVQGFTWYPFPDGFVLERGCVVVVFTSTPQLMHLIPAHVLSAGNSLAPLQIPPEDSTRTLDLMDSEFAIVDSVTWDDGVDAGGASITRCPDIIGDDFVRHNYPFDCSITDWPNLTSPGRTISGDYFDFPNSPCLEDLDGDDVLDIIDNCDEFNPNQADCDGNGIGDVCDISDHLAGGGDLDAIDCNQNGVLDSCEWQGDDCNDNNVLDSCEIADDLLHDCDLNGRPDECDIADGEVDDCTGNGIPDSCDIALGTSADCTDNGIPDECDIEDGTEADINGNGIPDVCEFPPACDVNGDGLFTTDDLLTIISNIGCVEPPDCPGDINDDGETDVGDVLEYISLGCTG